MNKSGPIIIIEDDLDDVYLLKSAFIELKTQNEIHYFLDGTAAYEFLTHNTEQPFLIISDINLPKIGGLELREKIHNNEQLRLKCIPYLFFTTSVQQKFVVEAYSRSVQGFFQKPNNYTNLVRVIHNIVEYWKDCQSPNVIL